MIVIVEGADGSGKSTLVKHLKELGYPTFSITEKSKPTEYIKWIDTCVENYDKIAICDRASFISDLVYRIVDGKNRRGMNLSQMSQVMRHEVIIIYCKTDTAFHDAITRGEDNITNKALHQKICDTYDMIMEMFKIFSDSMVYEYNWKTQDFSNIINFIKKGGRKYAIR